MPEEIIRNQCSRCLGTGVDSTLPPPGVCLGCGGTGWVGQFGAVDDTDVSAKLDALAAAVAGMQSELHDLWVQYITPPDQGQQ